MTRPRRRATLCLAGLSFLQDLGGGIPPQAFLHNVLRGHSSPIQTRTRKSLRCPTGLRRPASQNDPARETQPEQCGLRRSRALEATGQVLESVARTPVPPGYEGGKKQRKDGGDESDFNLNVGKVIDTLKRDYPRMFEEPLDFDIYTPDIQLRDPSGAVLTGLPSYQRLFATMRFFRQILVSEVSTVFRLSYDASRQQVRVCWHFVLDCTPVVSRPLHVDGISVYSLSIKGLVRRHDIETIIVNGTPAKPPFAKAWINLPAWVSKGLVGGGAAPGLSSSIGAVLKTASPEVGAALVTGRTRGETGLCRRKRARFAPWGFLATDQHECSLFARSALVGTSAASFGVGGWQGGTRCASSEGLGAQGVSRGQKALTGSSERSGDSPAPSTKDDQEGENGPSSSSNKEGDRDDEDKKMPPKRRQKKKGFWPIEIDGPLGCETSWDCSGGYVCCDLIVVKICCSNGVMQPKPGDLIPALRPIPGRGRTDLDQILVA